jgi:hypothetical protein
MIRSKSIERRINKYSNKVLDRIANDKGIDNTWKGGKDKIIGSILNDNSDENSVTDRMEWLMKQPLKKLNELFLADKLSEKETTYVYENRRDVRRVYNDWIKDYIFKYVMGNMNNMNRR